MTDDRVTQGLQPHSIGAEYPLTVVGTIRDGETRFYVMNLVTGERDSALYVDCGDAHKALALMHKGLLCMWPYGREATFEYTIQKLPL